MNENEVIHTMLVLRSVADQTLAGITQAREFDIMAGTPMIAVPGRPPPPTPDQCRALATKQREAVKVGIQTAFDIASRFVEKPEEKKPAVAVAPRLAGLIDGAAGGTNGVAEH